jgi:hypothetical protein
MDSGSYPSSHPTQPHNPYLCVQWKIVTALAVIIPAVRNLADGRNVTGLLITLFRVYISGKNALTPDLPSEQLGLGKWVTPFALATPVKYSNPVLSLPQRI